MSTIRDGRWRRAVWAARLPGRLRGQRHPRLWLLLPEDTGWLASRAATTSVRAAVAGLRPEIDFRVVTRRIAPALLPRAWPEAPPPATGFGARDLHARMALAGEGLALGDILLRLEPEPRGGWRLTAEPAGRLSSAVWLSSAIPNAVPCCRGSAGTSALAALIAAVHVQQTDAETGPEAIAADMTRPGAHVGLWTRLGAAFVEVEARIGPARHAATALDAVALAAWIDARCGDPAALARAHRRLAWLRDRTAFGDAPGTAARLALCHAGVLAKLATPPEATEWLSEGVAATTAARAGMLAGGLPDAAGSTAMLAVRRLEASLALDLGRRRGDIDRLRASIAASEAAAAIADAGGWQQSSTGSPGGIDQRRHDAALAAIVAVEASLPSRPGGRRVYVVAGSVAATAAVADAPSPHEPANAATLRLLPEQPRGAA